MRAPEAAWIYRAVRSEPGPILHLGSQTAEFRETKKPHINRELFDKLKADGVAVTHADIQDAPGVDFVGDIFDPRTVERLKAMGFGAVICANLLEHVRDRDAVATACRAIVGPGGLIVVTVPRSYPYHADPIDTYFRPSPADLGTLFGGQLIDSVVIEDGSLRNEMGRSPTKYLAMAALRVAYVVRPKVALAQAHRLLWLFRKFAVSCATIRV